MFKVILFLLKRTSTAFRGLFSENVLSKWHFILRFSCEVIAFLSRLSDSDITAFDSVPESNLALDIENRKVLAKLRLCARQLKQKKLPYSNTRVQTLFFFFLFCFCITSVVLLKTVKNKTLLLLSLAQTSLKTILIIIHSDLAESF